MKCKKCGYETQNKKSFSNHIRYGCKGIKPEKNCLWCGAALTMEIKPYRGRKFCNHECYAKWRSKNLRGKNGH